MSNHQVDEAEILFCDKCNKLTLKEVVRNERKTITGIICVLCEVPK